MRSNILESDPSSSIRVYVVWFDMLAADRRDLVDTRLLNDHRVTNYYDPKRATGSWFGQHVDNVQAIAWDAYYLYDSTASWADEPGPLVSTGSTVIGSSGDLGMAFKTFG